MAISWPLTFPAWTPAGKNYVPADDGRAQDGIAKMGDRIGRLLDAVNELAARPGGGASMTLATAPPGLRFTCPWDGTAWTYAGTPLTARPSQRADIFFEYAGAPAGTAGPSYAQAGDRRYDAS